jgi:hypothetical protein
MGVLGKKEQDFFYLPTKLGRIFLLPVGATPTPPSVQRSKKGPRIRISPSYLQALKKRAKIAQKMHKDQEIEIECKKEFN